MITAEQLLRIMPRAPVDWVDPLNAGMRRFGITTTAREAMFLAQLAVESSELLVLSENLNYTAERLMMVWPSHFKTLEDAQKYAHRPDALANMVYAHRFGNGDEISGDGWRYRGRGPIQVSFADNYRAFGRAVGDSGILLSPDRMLTKPVGALAAAWLFFYRGCLLPADNGDVEEVTHRVNGPAKEGLPNRKAYFATATGVLR